MNGAIVFQPVLPTESKIVDSSSVALEALEDGFDYHSTDGILEKTITMIPCRLRITIFCKGDAICSAENAVQGFALSVNDIFRKQ